MSKTALIGAPQVLAAAVVAVALAAVGALAVMTRKAPEGPAPLAALPAPVESAPAAPAETAAAPAVEAPQERAMPAFDVVRVDAEGNATIAGRAAAGDQVALLLDGVEIAKAAADGAGAFVFLMTLPPAEVPRALSLQVTGADGVARISEVDAIVAPFAGPVAVAAAEEAKPEAQAVAPAETTVASGSATESAAPVEGQAADVAAAAGAAAEAATAEAAVAAEKVQSAPAVVMAGPSGIEVKQAASAAESLGIDAISYTDTGDVEIAGRAPGRGFVRLYLDNKAVAEAKIAEDGIWRTALTSVDAGIYTLRVDELDGTGKVLNRFETPFRREGPEVLAKLTQAQPAATQEAATQGAEAPAAQTQEAGTQAVGAQTTETQAAGTQGAEAQVAGAEAAETQAAGTPAAETQASAAQAAVGATTEAQASGAQASGPQTTETQTSGTQATGTQATAQTEAATATVAAAAPQPAPKRVQAITVQPGNTLWAIAQERYGSGMLYVRLFDANKDAIRDPDLIYPGQVFTIPD